MPKLRAAGGTVVRRRGEGRGGEGCCRSSVSRGGTQTLSRQSSPVRADGSNRKKKGREGAAGEGIKVPVPEYLKVLAANSGFRQL